MIGINKEPVFHSNLYFIGIEASRVLTVGDSLTKGYFHGGKRFHPYGAKLEVLLNKDDHRCFEVEISGKNGEQSDNMLQRLSYYLNTSKYIDLLHGQLEISNVLTL
jgi:lysophospholipase L1-like esterase